MKDNENLKRLKDAELERVAGGFEDSDDYIHLLVYDTDFAKPASVNSTNEGLSGGQKQR